MLQSAYEQYNSNNFTEYNYWECALHIAHELRHIWQYNIDSDLITQESKQRKFIDSVKSYRKKTIEQDANGYAASAVYSYFSLFIKEIENFVATGKSQLHKETYTYDSNTGYYVVKE